MDFLPEVKMDFIPSDDEETNEETNPDTEDHPRLSHTLPTDFVPLNSSNTLIIIIII